MTGPITDPETSARMAGIRQAGTRIEQLVGEALHAARHRYRKNVKSLPGSPDFANKARRWAVFVNGCYWHHHTGCKKATVPKRNTGFWTDKFRANRARDARAIRALRRQGYKVVVVWECERAIIADRLAQVLEAGRVDTRET
ncbi:very short patch repair endonuclease [Sphingomonas dokdonensis]|uniref:Very short patch repair protein n=1 Tax=Sphingomonas dokdonensis TaxID=344880 RepID=A0A245ZV76_9SPHN|nr:DNA mismatch endonuclease Vsr [Sphingomonas dokdonensis]OWK33653.1 very short patch repair protein [Sphingomonas dokdonensis]